MPTKQLNNVSMIGHLAAEPEFITTSFGRTFLVFPLCLEREEAALSGPNKGEKVKHCDFHRIIFSGKDLQEKKDALQKGMAVFIHGKLVNRSFDDHEGRKHYRAEIEASQCTIISNK